MVLRAHQLPDGRHRQVEPPRPAGVGEFHEAEALIEAVRSLILGVDGHAEAAQQQRGRCDSTQGIDQQHFAETAALSTQVNGKAPQKGDRQVVGREAIALVPSKQLRFNRRHAQRVEPDDGGQVGRIYGASEKHVGLPDAALVIAERVASQERVEVLLARVEVSGRVGRLDRNGERSAPDEVERLPGVARSVRGAHR